MRKLLLIVGRLRRALLLAGCLLLVISLSACTFPWQKKAALQVKSIPKAKVYINDEEKGTTPFEEKKLSPGEITLKLVPEVIAVNLSPWERKVKLVGGVMSVVNWEFGESEQTSAGEILTLEKSRDKETASLSIVSIPDSAVVRLDGEARGFTPLTLDKITSGEREIVVTANGFKERNMKAKLAEGYRLTVNVKLAKAEEEEKEEEEEPETTPTPTPKGAAKATPSPKPTPSGPTPTPPERPYVKIKDTPTGWLRVREKATTTSEELGRINPGEMYPLLDEEGGWYKIRFGEDKEGWISGKYAEKYE